MARAMSAAISPSMFPFSSTTLTLEMWIISLMRWSYFRSGLPGKRGLNANVPPQFFDELPGGNRPQVAGLPFADGNRPGRGLSGAAHQHVRNLLERGLANLIGNPLGAQIQFGPDARLDE